MIVRLTGATTTRITHTRSGTEIDSAMAPEYGGPGGSFSSTDLLAAALGSCIATNIGPIADRHGIALDGFELRVRKELSGQPKRVSRLEIEVHCPGDLSPDLRQRFEQAAETCTVQRSLHPEMVHAVRFFYR